MDILWPRWVAQGQRVLATAADPKGPFTATTVNGDYCWEEDAYEAETLEALAEFGD